MWINGSWMEEPEMIAYVNDLIRERDAYKAELIDILRKAYTTQLAPYAAKLRLEELLGGATIC